MYQIFHVLPAEPDNELHGGPVVLISQILELLAEHSCEVISIAPLLRSDSTSKFGSWVEESRLADGSRLRRYGTVFRYHWSSLNPAAVIDCFWRIRRFDCVVIHSYRTFLGALAAVGCALHRVPYVVIPHGTCRYGLRNHPMKRFYDAVVGRWLLRRSDRIIFSSRRELEEARTVGLGGSYKIIPQGLPHPEIPTPVDLVARYAFSPRSKVILSLGRVVPPKNLELSIEVLTRLPANIVLLVVGELEESDYYATLLKKVEQLGVTARVRFAGALYGKEKWEALCSADAFLSTSLYESFGLAIAEALALGIPTVFSNTAGIAEFTVDSPLAFPRDLESQEMAEAIVEALRLRRQQPLQVINPDLDSRRNIRNQYWQILESAIRKKERSLEATP